MDDDDLRHGQAATHIAFGEANAILAGDSLHSLAFQALAEASGLSDAAKLRASRCCRRPLAGRVWREAMFGH